MPITFVMITPLQTENGAGVWMTSCPEETVLRIWGFWKRVSWELTLDHAGRQLSFCHWSMLYSHEQLYIHIYMQKYNDAITTSGYSSLEKYTSHFIRNGWKGLRKVMVECVGDWTKTATYWPPPSSSGHSSASFSFSWAAQPRAWGPSLSAESWFPPLDLEHWLQTLNSNCLTSCLTRVISLFYTHSIQPVNSQGYPLISSTGCTCYLHRSISHLTAWPGRRSICNRQRVEFSNVAAAVKIFGSLPTEILNTTRCTMR